MLWLSTLPLTACFWILHGIIFAATETAFHGKSLLPLKQRGSKTCMVPKLGGCPDYKLKQIVVVKRMCVYVSVQVPIDERGSRTLLCQKLCSVQKTHLSLDSKFRLVFKISFKNPDKLFFFCVGPSGLHIGGPRLATQFGIRISTAKQGKC
uniref:Uncharacterized protein n=1 Tax=Micrurus lemniscatus lemniscatus TaxID=129467 RepID=A0A2D4I3R9_MICLE